MTEVQQPPRRTREGQLSVDELYAVVQWLVEHGHGDLLVFWQGDGVFGRACGVEVDMSSPHYQGLFVGE